MAEFNIETYLDSLPEDTEEIDVSSRELEHLPDLSRFTNLIYLDCSDNQLTSLPLLNENLQELYCDNNDLTLLPSLNEKLKILEYNTGGV